MGILLLNIAFVSIGAVLGACAGWWLRGSELPGPSLVSPPERFDPKPSKQVASSVAVDSPAAADYGEVEAMMARLHQVAESVAADVGRHNNRVQEISSELSSNQGEIDVVGTVAKLIQMNEAMQNQLHSAEERLQAQAKEIESHVREARTDALTKLANRRAFDDEMARCVEEYRRSGRPSCVMMIDVDHFKKFNDTCGHQAGDEVLRGVGRVLRRSVCGKEIVCRYGGEEFAIIFPGSDLASARPAAERARAAIGQAMFEFEGRELKVTASGGVAEIRDDETPEQLVKRADDALYACKENGRNCGYWHDGSTSHPIVPAVQEQPVEAPTARAEEPAAETAEPVEEPAIKYDRRDRIQGVSERAVFLEDLERRVSEWKRGGAPLSIVLVEVDGLSGIREDLGDKAGEVVLRATAQFLKASMREMDHAARFDESQFSLLLPGAANGESAIAAERLRSAIAQCKLPVRGEQLTFTVSVGSSEISAGDEAEDLLSRGLLSLQAARDAGGNRCCYSPKNGDTQALACQTT